MTSRFHKLLVVSIVVIILEVDSESSVRIDDLVEFADFELVTMVSILTEPSARWFLKGSEGKSLIFAFH